MPAYTESPLAAPSVTGPNAAAEADAPRRYERKPKVPSDFKSAADFLEHIRTTYNKDLEADRKMRDEAILDARFVAGDQWEESVRAIRNEASKPTLTINRLPAFVAQLIGNRRLSDVGIKIVPDTGGDKEVARIREGLIRNIQKTSHAQYVYDKAFEQQIIGGLGQFQVHLDYAHDDVFEQDIRIAAIPNPLAVVWDQESVEPTGSDAGHVFVVDTLKRDDFKKRWPKAEGGEWSDDMSARTDGWDTQDTVQVASFWRMRSEKRTVALMQDSTVQDITDIDIELWWDLVAMNDGEPMVREVQRRYAEMYLCSSMELLSGPYKLPITRVPVFRVPGWEMIIQNDRLRWGMIRFARDPQKLHNYWRSTIAEKLVGAPKNKWLASDASVQGYEDAFRKSHLSDDPLLVWRAESGNVPTRVPPVEMEGALIQEAGMAAQDLRDVLNMHESSLGMQGNEVSGKAITARQRVGELGSVIYHDNLNAAIEQAGAVINQLIPFVYDSPRIVKILGEDMTTEERVRVNDSEDPQSVDITQGKYDVTVTTGPSYTTRRMESREEMKSLANSMPEVMGIAADLIVEAEDWPNADKIARRLRTQLPPGMISPEDMTEEEKAAAASRAEAQQGQQQLQQKALQLELQDKEADIISKRARAIESEARAIQARAQAQLALANAAKATSDMQVNEAKGAMDIIDQIEPAPTPAGNGANDR